MTTVVQHEPMIFRSKEAYAIDALGRQGAAKVMYYGHILRHGNLSFVVANIKAYPPTSQLLRHSDGQRICVCHHLDLGSMPIQTVLIVVEVKQDIELDVLGGAMLEAQDRNVTSTSALPGSG
jgi:hypothetical protein